MFGCIKKYMTCGSKIGRLQSQKNITMFEFLSILIEDYHSGASNFILLLSQSQFKAQRLIWIQFFTAMGEVGGWMPSCFRLMDIPLQGHPHISTSAVWMHLLSQTCQPSLRSDKFKSDPDLTLNNSSTFQIQHDAVYLWQRSIVL